MTAATGAAIMERIARTLERGIRAHSEQWYLFHNPWDVERDLELATQAAFGTILPAIKRLPPQV